MTDQKIFYGIEGYRIRELTIDEFVNLPDVPVGWRHIVRNLVLDLFDSGWNGKVQQIKEKFGGLRFYAALNQEQLRHVHAAEALSMKTCLVTGEPGEIRYDLPWIMPLCDAEYEKTKNKDR